jgi:PAS domain-containing protein
MRERLLLLLTGALPLGILQIDAERRIVHRNERLSALSGVSAADTLEEQLASVETTDLPALHAALDAMLESSTAQDLEIAFRRLDGRWCRRHDRRHHLLRRHNGTRALAGKPVLSEAT